MTRMCENLIACYIGIFFLLLSYNCTVVCLLWALQIAVNRLIFSYLYFVNKQQISNFQHIIVFLR